MDNTNLNGGSTTGSARKTVGGLRPKKSAPVLGNPSTNSTNGLDVELGPREDSYYDGKFAGLDNDSDGSEYGKPSKKKAKKTRKRRSPTPHLALPALSDAESEIEDDAGLHGLTKTKSKPTIHSTTSTKLGQSASQVVQAMIPAQSDGNVVMIKLDLSKVLGKRSYDATRLTTNIGSTHQQRLTPSTSIIQSSSAGNSGLNLTPATAPRAGGRRDALMKNEETRKEELKGANKKVGWNDLPSELKNVIYQHILVTKDPVDFYTRSHFARSAQFLRTSRAVNKEGSPILYGENAFHFEKCVERRGKFFEEMWKEVGWKDIRRFLEAIGPAKVAMMRYISFVFVDGTISGNPGLRPNEVRYVHDPTLEYCLRFIGENVSLRKFAFTFRGKKWVASTDYLFIRAFKTIKTEEIISTGHPRGAYYGPEESKIEPALLKRLLDVMTIPTQDNPEVNKALVKGPKVLMYHERTRQNSRWYW